MRSEGRAREREGGEVEGGEGDGGLFYAHLASTRPCHITHAHREEMCGRLEAEVSVWVQAVFSRELSMHSAH